MGGSEWYSDSNEKINDSPNILSAFENSVKIGSAGNKTNESQLILPTEVIIEILSQLPPKSLIKFQIVCKEWHKLINGTRYFLERHMDHTTFAWFWKHVRINPDINTSNTSPVTERFRILRGCDGLLLMQSWWPDIKYCLWNPATRRLLELPDPHKDSYEFAFSYVPSTRNYKILSVHRESSGVNVFEVLTPSQSKAWRRLTFPDHILQVSKTKKRKVSLVSAGAVVCIGIFNVGTEMVSLDLENECFSVTPLPKGSDKSWAIDWNGKLGFAELEVGINLQVVVLEDYKKQIWGEKKSIQLPFMKDDDYKGKTLLMFAKNGELWFWLKNKKIFTYTIGNKRVTNIKTTESDGFIEVLYAYKPSMVSFEGMVPDTKLQRFRPQSLL